MNLHPIVQGHLHHRLIVFAIQADIGDLADLDPRNLNIRARLQARHRRKIRIETIAARITEQFHVSQFYRHVAKTEKSEDHEYTHDQLNIESAHPALSYVL